MVGYFSGFAKTGTPGANPAILRDEQHNFESDFFQKSLWPIVLSAFSAGPST